MKTKSLSNDLWKNLSSEAWRFREHARVLGKTQVGAAVISGKEIFGGCNIEHQFRSHDIHAEVSAISSMISSGKKKLDAILVVVRMLIFSTKG